MSPPLKPLAEHEFATALREGAARLRFARADIARLVGVTPRTVSRWSNGRLLPRRLQHARLLDVFAPAGRAVVDPMRHALGLPPLPSPAAPAPPPAVDPAVAAKELELALLAVAESLDCSPRKTRTAAIALFARVHALHLSADEARAMLVASAPAEPAPLAKK